MKRARAEPIPASANDWRARCWWSISTSMVVRVAAGAPCSNQSPLTPAPVPISRMLFASIAAASTASCAPTAGDTGSTPSSSEC